MGTVSRRHDIDALRVIAIGLLIVYHVAIGFQSWGLMVGFISHVPSAEAIWRPMTALNIWRIPLLFFVSGMGVSFAFGKRTPVQLLIERSRRILLPFVFGILCIVPLHMLVLQGYYGWSLQYSPGPGHLWFLGNIMVYTVIAMPLFMLMRQKANSRLCTLLHRGIAHPLGWLVLAGLFVVEALLLNPYPYEMYAMNWHGFWLGLLAFLAGYLFVFSGALFWERLTQWRWLWLAVAVTLFGLRTFHTYTTPVAWLLSIESNAWVFAVLAFGHRFLDKSSTWLRYLSQAAYPIYIIHMLWLYLASAWLFPIEINLYLKFVMVLVLTIGASLLTYEFSIRRFGFLGVLFGLNNDRKSHFKARNA